MRDINQNDSLVPTTELSNESTSKRNVPIINYLNIPFIVFFLLILLTGGLYRVYWLYHNWKAIKKAEKSDIYPFWRAIFGVFFINELFQHVCETAKNQGYRGFIKYRLIDGCYVTFLVLGYTCSLLTLLTISSMVSFSVANNAFAFLFYVLTIIFLVLKYLCFWPIQRAINFYKDQVEQQHLSTMANEASPVIGYFDISPVRFLIFNILTARLYSLYWSYKNWQAIKRAEKRKIIPFWRSIFSIFFIYGLFKKIYLSARDQGFPKRIPYWQLGVGYIVFFYFLNFLGRLAELPARMSETWYYVLVLSIGIPFDCLFFRPLQEAINFYNNKVILNYKPRKRFTHGEVMLLIIGALFYISLFTGGLEPSKLSSTTLSSKFTEKSTVWETFRPESKNFEVKFPTHPIREKEEFPLNNDGLIAQYEGYESTSSQGTIYSVSQITYPKEIDLSKLELKDFVDDVVASSSSNKLINSQNTYVGNHAAVDFLVQNRFGYMRGKIILVGQTKYMLMYIYTEGNYNEKDYKQFVNSFSLRV